MSEQKNKVIDQLKDDPLMPMRHSAEHVLHASIEAMFPGAKKVMGPPIKDGFYGDFDNLKITEEDLPKIEETMNEIISLDLPLEMKEVSYEEAKELFKENKFKLEFVEEFNNRGDKITICEMGNENTKYHDIDLCAGHHIQSTGKVGAIKLLSIAGSYWRGDEKNEMLTRIYATAFEDKEKLEAHIKMVEEMQSRNHRKIGQEQELFAIIPEIGKGLPVWLPNGYMMRRELEDYMIRMERRYGYEHILTPNIYKDELFKISGHLDFYKESMYAPVEIDNETYYLKPMNCPAGMMVYKMKPHSYKELPIKMGEFGTVYRYEKSGELHGLQRVRGFTQNDAHIFCTEDQLDSQFDEVLEMLQGFYKTLGFTNYKFKLALSDPEKEKYKFCGTRENWVKAENALRSVLERNNIEYIEEIGDAAFYGPKIDIQAVNVFGKEDSISTLQVDFNLPERFKLTYIDNEGNEKQPFVIHRALIGSFERFFSFLIEYYAGEFPMWLSPQQVEIIPIADTHVEYANEVAKKLRQHEIRVVVNSKNEPMGAKIRNARLKKVPYMMVIGDREVESNQVSVKIRGGEDKGALDTNQVVDKLKEIYLTKSLSLW